MKKNIIIFAPHQDDEVIGCGGIIQKLISNQDNVYLAIATQSSGIIKKYNAKEYSEDCAEKRNRECFKAASILGIGPSKISYLISPEYHMRLDSLDKISIITTIEGLLQNVKPSSIFIPAYSLNQDHKIMNECLLTASRPHVYSGNILEYEVENEINFCPNFYVPLCREDVEKKVQALSCYQTQMKKGNTTLSKDYILTRAKYRGRELYVQYAEAFCIVRGRLY